MAGRTVGPSRLSRYPDFKLHDHRPGLQLASFRRRTAAQVAPRAWHRACCRMRRSKPMTNAARPRPEDFLELVERGKRGRLKLYIGFAAGVGKTYRMLEEAHALKKRGVDVVIGFVETHGRAETAALIEGLEVVPAPARSSTAASSVEEMSLDNILTRNPAVAHRRRAGPHQRPGQPQPQALPGRARAARRRHQRHRRLQRPAPREPERPRRARDRRGGARDRPRQLPQAGRPGGQPGSRGRGSAGAAARRARSTRPTRSPGRSSTSSRTRTWPTCASWRCARWPRAWSGASAARPAVPDAGSGSHARRRSRVMVCLSSSSPRAAALLRKGSRLAGRLQHRLVRGLRRDARARRPDRIDAEAQRHLLANIERARELGAEVVRLRRRRSGARHPRLRPLAQRRPHRGRAARTSRGGGRRCGRTIPLRLVREAAGFDLHIVSLEEEPGAVTLEDQAGAGPGAAGAGAGGGGGRLGTRHRPLGEQASRSSRTTTAACWRPSA